MRGLPGILSRWLPPLVVMAVIYFLSAQPNLSSGLGAWDTVLRKGAHMVEFGLLWALLWRAGGYGEPRVAVGVALLYAASDELHQTFVPGRVGSPLDWAIDAAGIGLAGLLAAGWSRRRASDQRQSQPRSLA